MPKILSLTFDLRSKLPWLRNLNNKRIREESLNIEDSARKRSEDYQNNEGRLKLVIVVHSKGKSKADGKGKTDKNHKGKKEKEVDKASKDINRDGIGNTIQ